MRPVGFRQGYAHLTMAWMVLRRIGSASTW